MGAFHSSVWHASFKLARRFKCFLEGGRRGTTGLSVPHLLEK